MNVYFSFDLIFDLVTDVHFSFCLLILRFQVWSLKLEQEEEKNKALTEALQTLATEHHKVQQSLFRTSALSTLTEDDFYDAESGQQLPAGQLVFLPMLSH